MKRKKAIFLTIYDDDGNIIEEIPMTAADDDWMRAGRLRKKAQEGDEEAAKQLKEMENTQMYYFDEDDEEEWHSNSIHRTDAYLFDCTYSLRWFYHLRSLKPEP